MPSFEQAQLREISLPTHLETAIIENAGTIDPELSHFEACSVAAELVGKFIPEMQQALAPVLRKEHFAFKLTATPAAAAELDTVHFENVMRMRTIGLGLSEGEFAITEIEEKDKPLLSRIRPVQGMEHTQSFGGSLDELKPHQENQPDDPSMPNPRSVHDTKTSFVNLGTVSNDLLVPASYTPIKPALELLRRDNPGAFELLFAPEFRLKAFDTAEEAVERNPESIVRDWDGSVYFDLGDFVGMNDKATTALQMLEAAVFAARAEIVPKKGETVIVVNDHSTHGRGKFQPDYSKNGFDRYSLVAHIREANPTRTVWTD